MTAAANRTLGVGLVGLGWMGRAHAMAYARAPLHFSEQKLTPRFVIAADNSGERGRLALGLGFEAFTCDWHEVVGHPDVEAVSITVPNDLHRDVAISAAQAGKHVWIEKPVGRSLAETTEIAKEVRMANVSCMVGLDLRFVPVLRRARDVVTCGHLGEITSARGFMLSDFGAPSSARDGWRFEPARAGYGAVGDLMVHVLDLLASIVGSVSEVCSAATAIDVPDAEPPVHAHSPNGRDDHVISLLRFAGGALGSAEASRVAVGRHSDIGLDVYGTRGALSWRFDRLNELSIYPAITPGTDVGAAIVTADQRHGAFGKFQPAQGLPMGLDDLKVIEAHEFCQAIATGARCQPGVEDALSNVGVLAAIQRSWRTGRWELVDRSERA